MAYVITDIRIISGELSVDLEKLRTLECKGRWGCWTEAVDDSMECIEPYWEPTPEGSFHSVKMFPTAKCVDEVRSMAPALHCSGPVDLLLTWEGGDSHSGLRLHSDGRVVEHRVSMILGEPT